MKDHLPPTIGIMIGGALGALLGLTFYAMASVPPTVNGAWINLTVCSRAASKDEHDRVLKNLGTKGEIWARKTAIIGVQDDPHPAGCAMIATQAGNKFLVMGKASELVGLLQ